MQQIKKLIKHAAQFSEISMNYIKIKFYTHTLFNYPPNTATILA